MEPGDLHQQLTELTSLDPAELTDRELFAQLRKIEELNGLVHGHAMRFQAAARDRGVHRVRHYRSAATGLSAETRLSSRTCASHLNLAGHVVNNLPKVHRACIAGVLNSDQVNLIHRLTNHKEFLEAAVRDQNLFINWANEPWAVFNTNMRTWAEYNDPSDPQDCDRRAEAKRRLLWGQGVDKTVLGEFSMPNDTFEQFLTIVRPVYDKLFKQECAEAKAALQDHSTDRESSDEDEPANQDEHRYLDLSRTDKQRWLDALMIVLRIGGRHITKLEASKASTGLDVPLHELDPGVITEVIIVCDQETLTRQIAKQAGTELPDRNPESLATYRCETLSGLPITPATALKTLELNHFRRMIHKPGDLDFALSKRARYFNGPKRTALMIRDRHCQDPGCDTPAKHCQGDHIIEYSKGGLTIPRNGQIRCGPCNRHKTWLEARGLWAQPGNRHNRSRQRAA